MKRLRLLATAAVAMLGISDAALAADMPVKAPMPPPPPPFSWTGFYIGGNVGVAWGERNVTDVTGLTFSHRTDSALIGGGQVGFNYQMGTLVLGVEGDFDWAGSNNRNDPGVAVLNSILRVDLRDRTVATLAARFGFAAERWLFYGKAGGGWVGVSNFTITNLTPPGGAITIGNSRNNSGFLVGAGFEFAVANNWTLKAEYDYVGLSSRTFVVPVGAPALVGDVFTNRSHNIQEFKVGFNYLFNGSSGF